MLKLKLGKKILEKKLFFKNYSSYLLKDPHSMQVTECIFFYP